MADARLKIILDALDNASDDIKKLQQELDGVDKTTRKTDKATVGLDEKFKNFTRTAGMVTAGLVAAGFAVKKFYDFTKQGAELDYAIEKFNQLAVGIGTTSDALLNDLGEATKGTRSKMELVALGGDLMALGLAKSHDEVVRLTRVAGALNMDMNQLVLTLTNQTTMRFDALGVSVDGFDAKVKKLEKTGLDTNAAFTEAFLQQAEQQIEKVGDAADKDIGVFKRFESQLKNNWDGIKKGVSGPAADFLRWGMKAQETLGNQEWSWKRLIPWISAADTAIRGLNLGYDELVGRSPQSQEAIEATTDRLNAQYEAWLALQEQMPQSAESWEATSSRYAGQAAAWETASGGISNLGTQFSNLAGWMADANGQVDPLAGKIDKLVSDSLKPMTQEMLQQKIMATLTGEALLQYAVSTGQLDERSYGLQRALQILTEEFDLNKDGVVDAKEATEEYWDRLSKIDGTHVTTTITTEHVNTYQDVYLSPVYDGGTDHSGGAEGGREAYATGGPTTAGKPATWQEYGYGGEMFVPSTNGYVLSRADAERILAQAAQGGGKRGGDTYNLNIYEAGSRGNVVQDFETLKAYARMG